MVNNDIVSHLDMLPTILAAAGVPDVKEQLLKGMQVGDTTFKVHLDGYNLLPLLTGQTKVDPRKEFLYFNDDSDLVALRYDNWKIVFMEQKEVGTFTIWSTPFVTLRVPKIFNLRTDPYERADITSNTYYGAGYRRQVHWHVRGIPAEPEGRQLQPGPSHGQADARRDGQRLTPRL